MVELYHTYKSCESDIATAQEMAGDPEMREFADAEIKAGREKLEQLEVELQKQLLPKDPNDERNVFLEVRAGTGCDEAAIFAGYIFRMYVRFAERRRWQVEIISESPGEMGGYKEVIARIIGQGAYSVLKFESGAHRVQRVPATETQGRIHTSACTVAILPEADEVGEVELNPSDLRIDTFRASGAGGQHINKTDSAIRITHLPTGIVVECQDDRSQHKNKAQAMSVLAARIMDVQLRERNAKEAAGHAVGDVGGLLGILQDFVLHVDGAIHAQSQGERVRGSGINADDVPFPLQPDDGVKRIFTQFGDHYFVDVGIESHQHILDQVVSHGARGRHLLNLQGNGVGLVNPHPDRQYRLGAYVFEDHDGHIGHRIHHQPANFHLDFHRAPRRNSPLLISPFPQKGCWEKWPW